MINRLDDDFAVEVDSEAGSEVDSEAGSEVDSEAETKAGAAVASWDLEGYLTFYLESKTWLQGASLGLRLNRDGQANDKEKRESSEDEIIVLTYPQRTV